MSKENKETQRAVTVNLAEGDWRIICEKDSRVRMNDMA